MAALTREKEIQRYGTIPNLYTLPVNGGSKILKGAMVALNNEGNAVPVTTATGLVVIGVARHDADNTNGADAAIEVDVEPGVFKVENSSAGDLIAKTEVGKIVYGVDDQTVAKTDGTGTRSAAGRVVRVDSDGVRVLFGIFPLT